MTAKKKAYENLAKNMIADLKKRGMEGYYCDNKEEACALAMSMVEPGASVSWGGSESIKEIGLLKKLCSADNLDVIDRSRAVTEQDRKAVYARAAACDYYFMSTNAITVNGELVNIDGNGNRVACLIHGPEHVIIIAGMNKVESDVESAVKRVRNIAAPPNGARLATKTPCATLGKCGDCVSDDCMCCQVVITRRSRHKGRIHVILVGEELGF